MDQASLTEYGSVDEGKTIFKTEEFHELMLKLAEQLAIKTSKIKDEKDQEFELAGSIDCKGIRGTDRRKYLLDLIRLTPRDANYPGEEFSTWVCRWELLLTYQRNKSLEFASEKMKSEP